MNFSKVSLKDVLELKSNSRWLSIGSGVTNIKENQKIPITLIITRRNYLEHFVMFWTELDPPDITEKIVECLISQSWYSKTLIQGIWVHGSTIAGFGIIRHELLRNNLKAVLLSIVDEKPSLKKIRNSLLSNFIDGKQRWDQFQENSIVPRSIKGKMPECNLWIANYGISLETGIEMLKKQRIGGCLPEGLRIASLIGRNTFTSY
ncbi:MAG: hypothetical protein HeimC3_38280 [Candidatus Heimdallarchaeota archaeon LC_3]|nr:MAG: hypothetical protein HeimC3_38280 [Candidatus Heimdallarchaeota archaeon LC_3]